MKKVSMAMPVATMLLARSAAADITKSNLTKTSTAGCPGLKARLNQRLRLARLLASRQPLL